MESKHNQPEENEESSTQDNLETISIGTPSSKRILTNEDPDEEDTQLETMMISSKRTEPEDLTPQSETRIYPEPSRYNSRKHLGQGGMKVIELVKDDNMKRVVAKATIHPDNMTKDNIKSFIYEARLTAALQSPNILQVYDIGENEKGEPFFIMEHLDGVTLHEVIKTVAHGDKMVKKSFSLDKLIDIFTAVCETIQYAHKQKTLHLDLKPENILISKNGKVHVIDWGLAIVKNEGGDRSNPAIDEFMKSKDVSESISGKIRGTPGYLAPEQIMGKLQYIKPQTDIFGLGGILYTILCYKEPIPGENSFDRVSDTLHGEITPPSLRSPKLKVDSQLEKICMKALKRNSNDRYESVEGLLKDIRRFKNTPLRKSIIKLAVVLMLITGSIFTYHYMANRSLDSQGNWIGNMPKNATELHIAIEKCNDNYKFIADNINTDNSFDHILLNNSQIDNLSPLVGLPIKKLDLSSSNIKDLSYLEQLPLNQLNLYNTKISDLSGLKSIPLETLILPPLENLNKEFIEILKSMTNLKFVATTTSEFKHKQTKDEFLEKWNMGKYVIWGHKKHLDTHRNWIGPIPKLIKQVDAAIKLTNSNLANIHAHLMNKEMEITYLHLHSVDNISALRNIKTLNRVIVHDSHLKDISPLTDLPIKHLAVHATAISDYSNLKTMDLDFLNISLNNLKDISFLKGLKLKKLFINSNKITNISVLRDMDLIELNLVGNKVKDISVLKGMPIQKIGLPKLKHLRGNWQAVLKSFKHLKCISTNDLEYRENQTVEKFWEKYNKGAYK